MAQLTVLTNKLQKTYSASNLGLAIRVKGALVSAGWGGKMFRGSDMSNENKQNLQDTFLNSVRKSKTQLTIFLMNGVKLQGVVTWLYNFCVLLRRDGQVQLVYKHAISTIMPSEPVSLYDEEKIDDD